MILRMFTLLTNNYAMLKSFFTKSLHSIISAYFCISLSMLCICCSKNEVEAIQMGYSSEKDKEHYDSVYNAIYNLYVVSNDTTIYNLQDYDCPLTSEEEQVCMSLNEYAVKMLSDYNSTNSENTLLSPFNASILYSLMANFTDEKKKDNPFKESMGIASAKNETINSLFRKFINQKDQSSKQNENEEQMSFASTLWMNKKSAVYKSFLSTTKYYGFGVKGIDLDQESNIDLINSYVHSKIGSNDAEISKSSIEKSKPLVTSSMSFKGEWAENFYVDSAQTNLFANSNGSKTLCKILRTVRKERYSRFDTFDMIEIPYKGGTYSMYFLLPHTVDGLSNSLKELNTQGVVRCMDLVSDTTRTFHGVYPIQRDTTTSNGTFTVVDTLITDTIFDIRIPKFKLCTSTGLNPNNIAGNSSTKLMFQTNLPKISPNGYMLSNVFQSCSLEINEQSTSASSGGSIIVTGTQLTFSGNPYILRDYSKFPELLEEIGETTPQGRIIKETVIVPFHVSYPFAVFIREKEIGTIPFACSIKTLDF